MKFDCILQNSIIVINIRAMQLMTIDMLEVLNSDDSKFSFFVLSIWFHRRCKIVFHHPSSHLCTGVALVAKWKLGVSNDWFTVWFWGAWFWEAVDTRVFPSCTLFFSIPTTGVCCNPWMSTPIVGTKSWANKYDHKKGDGEKLHFLKAWRMVNCKYEMQWL